MEVSHISITTKHTNAECWSIWLHQWWLWCSPLKITLLIMVSAICINFNTLLQSHLSSCSSTIWYWNCNTVQFDIPYIKTSCSLSSLSIWPTLLEAEILLQLSQIDYFMEREVELQVHVTTTSKAHMNKHTLEISAVLLKLNKTKM